MDTFDPKPDAPSEIRGEFGAIETNVSGIRLSEHLPNTAKVMDKIALVRSLSSNIAAHEQASQYLLTGYKPLPTLEYPSYGAVVANFKNYIVVIEGPQNDMRAEQIIAEAKRLSAPYELVRLVARDGRFLINMPTDESELAPITLILNWKPRLTP